MEVVNQRLANSIEVILLLLKIKARLSNEDYDIIR